MWDYTAWDCLWEHRGTLTHSGWGEDRAEENFRDHASWVYYDFVCFLIYTCWHCFSMCLCAFYVVWFILQGSSLFFFKNNCDLSIVFKTEESGISVFSLFSSAMMILLKTFFKKWTTFSLLISTVEVVTSFQLPCLF